MSSVTVARSLLLLLFACILMSAESPQLVQAAGLTNKSETANSSSVPLTELFIPGVVISSRVEIDGTNFAMQVLINRTKPAKRTISKALALCQVSYRYLQCAWMTLESATRADGIPYRQVTALACMDDLRSQCGRLRRTCDTCGACSDAPWPPAVENSTRECFCSCPSLSVSLYGSDFYRCDEVCDGKFDCSNGKDEVRCPGRSVRIQWSSALEPFARWIISLVLWAVVGFTVVFVYTRLKARGHCGTSPQQQQQQQQHVASVPLVNQTQQQQQPPPPQSFQGHPLEAQKA